MPDLMQNCSVPGCPYRECPGQGVCVMHGGTPRPDPPRSLGRAPIDAAPKCTARRRDGGACRQPALKGSTVCRVHGGSAEHVREAAAQRVTEGVIVEQAAAYGVPRRITAREALTDELARTQGHVDWLAAQLSHHNTAEWLGVYQAERAHLARLAEKIAATDNRVAEALEANANQAAEKLEQALVGILTALGHDIGEQRVRGIVVYHMKKVAGRDHTPTLPPPALVRDVYPIAPRPVAEVF